MGDGYGMPFLSTLINFSCPVMLLDSYFYILLLRRSVSHILYFISLQEDKRSKAEFAAQSDSGVKIPENIWYTCQTVGNACGTIAILHLLANLPEREGYSKFKPGSWIEKFMTKTAAADKDARAEALEDDNEIEAAHSAAERQSAAHFDSANGEEVDTHFIALVGVNGRLYEFDGRKGGVIDHGVINEEEGIKGAAGKVMMGFMERLEGENRFNIIAVANSPAADFN